jgi:transposase-like protein
MVEGARRATGTIPSPRRSGIQATPMTQPNSSGEPLKSPPKKRRFLSAEKKFQIYLEAQSTTKPIGELLRREGLFSTDLARIRNQVREGALQRLSAKPGKKQDLVGTTAYDAIKLELQEKERAMADLTVELAILRKKTSGGSWER